MIGVQHPRNLGLQSELVMLLWIRQRKNSAILDANAHDVRVLKTCFRLAIFFRNLDIEQLRRVQAEYFFHLFLR